MTLNHQLFSASQVRELDRCAIEEHGLPSIVLMKRAGRVAFNVLLEQWPSVSAVHVFCGGGNNGGDGYVIAALAAQQGLPSRVWQLSTTLSGAADEAYQYAIQEGVNVEPFDLGRWQQWTKQSEPEPIVVDALLGTGFKGKLSEDYREAIFAINESRLPVLSVDIPSGADPDNGSVQEQAIEASLTVSFMGQKLGNLIGKGRLHSGRRLVDDLSIPTAVYGDSKQQPLAKLLDYVALSELIPARRLDAHKGDFGHLLVVGGDNGYGGAPLMAAQMALRSGSGLVSVAAQPSNISAMIAHQPELMAVGVVSGQELLPYLEKPNVIVVGPGLGQTAWSEQMLYHCLHAGKKLVLDADGLNIVAQGRLHLPPGDKNKTREWVLTPHPGEAARLLDTTIDAIEKDRVSAIYALQDKYGGTIVLKGAGSLVLTSKGHLFVCDAGNPGMASGGMGDVLSGLLGSLIAQGLTIDDAACLGVLLHAMAADNAAKDSGQQGLLATDLLTYVRALLNKKVDKCLGCECCRCV